MQPEQYIKLLKDTVTIIYDRIYEHMEYEGHGSLHHTAAMNILASNREQVIHNIKIPVGLTTELLLKNAFLGTVLKMIHLFAEHGFTDHLIILQNLFTSNDKMMRDIKIELTRLYKNLDIDKSPLISRMTNNTKVCYDPGNLDQAQEGELINIARDSVKTLQDVCDEASALHERLETTLENIDASCEEKKTSTCNSDVDLTLPLLILIFVLVMVALLYLLYNTKSKSKSKSLSNNTEFFQPSRGGYIL